MTLAVSAQHRGRSFGGGHRVGSRVHTRVSVGIGYPYFYYPGYWYDPWYGYGYNRRSSSLAMDIADIKDDYKDKIWSARHDKSLSRPERKKEIRRLKTERDKEIRDAERDYYKRRTSNNRSR